MAVAAIMDQDVLDVAPELSTLRTLAWVGILNYVNELDLTGLGETPTVTRLARVYLAAHFGSMTKRAGAGIAGPVTSESAGGIRRSYGLLMLPGQTGLGATLYGQLYESILNMSNAHGPFVV